MQCFKRPWPGISRSVFGDHGRFMSTYFSPYPGYFFTGDGARRDADGYYWITGIAWQTFLVLAEIWDSFNKRFIL